jgi:hypothetical protein
MMEEMEEMDELAGIKSKVLGDLQNDMAKRRLLTIKVDLDTGTVENDGGGAPKPEPAAAASGDALAEPDDVVSRLKKLA